MTESPSDKTAVLFPGQGSQYATMGADLELQFPQAKQIFDKAQEQMGFSFSEVVFSADAGESLNRTAYAQGAILAVSYAVYKLAEPYIAPDFLCGHSLGELTAMAAAEVFSLEDVFSLIKTRARLMDEASQNNPGMMMAVIGLDDDAVEAVVKSFGEAQVANYNSPGQVVVALLKEGQEALSAELREAGARKVMPLRVSGPFHSRWMKEASEGFYEEVKAKEISDPRIPIIGNTEGQVITTAGQAKEELRRHMHSSVRWVDTINRLHGEGVGLFVEEGPGEVLSGLAKRILPEAQTRALCKAESLEELSAARI